MRLTRLTVIGAVVLQAIALAFLVSVMLDVRAHANRSRTDVNQWGYRGDVKISKAYNELRVAVLGGSAAFGSRLPSAGDVPGHIEIELKLVGAPRREIYTVANLAEPQAGADSYAATLQQRYEYLRPDVICIYDGYDALSGTPSTSRQRSLSFRWFGYLPMSSMLGGGRWLSDPDSGIADVLLDISSSAPDVSCEGSSAAYCRAMADTVRLALERHRRVIVASPPSVSERHELQQQSLGAVLMRDFGGDAGFTWLDLGSALDIHDSTASPDGVRLNEVGAHVIGQRIARAVLRMLGRPIEITR